MKRWSRAAASCVLPHFMACAEPRLVRVLPEKISILRSFWLLVHADLKDVARVRAIMDFMVREVRAARALFLPVTQRRLHAGRRRP